MLTVRKIPRTYARANFGGVRGFGEAGQGATDLKVTDFLQAIYAQADTEQRVAIVNNYLQLLWRTALSQGLSKSDSAMQTLDGYMAQWWAWKQQFDAAVFRRWVPFSRDWNGELNTWKERVVILQGKLDDATNGAVSQSMEQRGLTPDIIPEDDVSAFLKAIKQMLRSPWFWPVVGTVGALALLGYSLKLYKGIKAELT